MKRYYQKGTKYHARKIVVDGMEFASQKEARRWSELKLMQKAGAISDLRRQVKFELIPAQREQDTVGSRGGIHRGALIEREVSYWADFVYVENGKTVVEDVKGMKSGTAYDVFTIKRKLLLWRYGIKVKET